MTTQGQRIRALAAEAGLNIAQLAKKADIDSSAMVNIARDNIGLGSTRAQRIADALGRDVSEVLLPREEAVTLASVARRLQSLEEELDIWKGLVLEALALLGLQANPEAGQGSRVRRVAAPRRRAAAATGTDG